MTCQWAAATVSRRPTSGTAGKVCDHPRPPLQQQARDHENEGGDGPSAIGNQSR
jgi:hypothetical protein